MRGLRWFATHVDRDYLTHEYGNGIRIYVSTHANPVDNVRNFIYCTVEGVCYDEINKVLTLKDEFGENFVLKNEPDNIYFKNTLHNDWKIWDNKWGPSMEQDRSDYEPWALDSLESLAIELRVHSNEGVNMYYKV